MHQIAASLSLVLLKGQLSYMQVGFHPAALCSAGSEVAAARTEESTPIITVSMEREISPFRDLISLIRLWWLLREVASCDLQRRYSQGRSISWFGGMVGRIPCRVYTLRGAAPRDSDRIEERFGFTERIACACARIV